MADYYFNLDGYQPDELQGGTDFPVELWNVNVGASAVIERGMLLSASSASGVFSLVDSSLDAANVLVIASEDFTAGSDGGVVPAYAAGKFNRDKIKLGGTSALTIETFEQSLRTQNIHLGTSK